MLQSLKKQYQVKEQAFTYTKMYYKHLSDLSNDEILAHLSFTTDELVDYVKYIKENQLAKSESILDQSKQAVCQCVDRNGKIKNLYTNKAEAESVCIQVKNKQQISLAIYTCPSTDGWHLSKG